MAVLICGGAGYIGSHAVRAFQAQGEEIVVMVSLLTGHREAVPTGVRFYQSDICDGMALD